MLPFLQTGPVPDRRRPNATPYARGLLSNDLWDVDEELPVDSESSPERVNSRRQAATDDSDVLPEPVISLYPDLDDESRSFLRFGPRSAHERLAYAQGIHPRAHATAQFAPAREQRVFEERGVFDADRSFIGPNGRVYLRDDNSNEFLGARIRRGYERAVGGFAKLSVADSLKEIREATRSKRADVESVRQRPSPQEERRRAFLREQRINPDTWTLAEPLDENAQKTFRESDQLWPAIAPFAFAGPDGRIYRRSEAVREDPFSQYRRVREWQEAQRKSAEAPPPDLWDVYWRAVAAGAALPGPISGRAVPPNQPIPPWSAIPAPTAQPKARQGGRPGNAETRAQNERIAQFLIDRDWELYVGPRRVDGKERLEERIPGPFGGQRGVLYPDKSFIAPNREFVRINTTDVDAKTGKPTVREQEGLLKIFKAAGGNVIGISKKDQLRKLKQRLER